MKPYTVSEISAYLKNMFTEDYVLKNVCVCGEVSNCKYHSTGTIYLTLKDEGAKISVIIFAGSRKNISCRLADGIQIEASGYVSLYEKSGSYSLIVTHARAQGLGVLYEKFIKIRDELEEAGMFDEAYKKPIPQYVKKVGVVTASTGAAFQDILNVSGRRNRYVDIILYPAKVQGEGAVESIVKGIRSLDKYGVDVIIIGRGGGSIEDLWAFNDTRVAEAIFASQTPIISGVGHETDTTIADYVADMRAPTPSAAAELAIYDYDLLQGRISDIVDSMSSNMHSLLERQKFVIDRYKLRLSRLSPGTRLSRHKMRLDAKIGRMRELIHARLDDVKTSFLILSQRMKSATPLAKLEAGYAYAIGSDGKRIGKVAGLKKGDEYKMYLKDGHIEARVLGVHVDK